jgi:RNA polymerase subunit RPABC4/transcription elongation factor Spt4
MNNQPNPPNPSAGGAKVYEMQWDCKFCGTKKLLGKTHRFCPNCGAQQDPTWRYFPSDAEKVAVQDHVYVGADKICPACKTLNAAAAEFCGNCGSPMTKAAEAKKVGERQQAAGQAFETEDVKARQQAQQAAAQAGVPAPAKPKGRSRLPIIVLALAVIIGGVIFLLTRTTTNNAYVTGYRWERTIDIESLGPVAQSQNGDCSLVPAGAYNLDQRTEKVGSHQVQDGETCTNKQVDQGDGTFKEEQQCSPNYKTVDDYGPVCHYTVNLWTHSRTAKAEGDKGVTVAWPETNLRTGNTIGSEREQAGGRNEAYYLEFKGDGGKTFECAVPLDQWNATTMESAFTVEVGTVLKNVKCDTLKPAG